MRKQKVKLITEGNPKIVIKQLEELAEKHEIHSVTVFGKQAVIVIYFE